MNTPKPNLFQYGTKELTQDAVLTWFLQWADPTHAQSDPKLHECAQAVTRCLLGKPEDFVIHSVKTWQQWQNIDIVAEVNGNIALAIEDKTISAEHSDQLERYRSSMLGEYSNRPEFVCDFAYVKTGNESLKSLEAIKSRGWRVVDRLALLKILKAHPTDNNIAQDFTDYLQSLEDSTSCFNKRTDWPTDGWAVEGFCLELQRRLGTDWDWGWVSNPAGGFCACWNSGWSLNDLQVYLQFELGGAVEPKLTVRVAGDNITTELLYDLFSQMQSWAAGMGLVLEKPARFRPGGTSALAVVTNIWGESGWQKLDWEQLMENLQLVQKFVSQWVQSMP